MAERAADDERQRPEGRQEHDPFGGYFGGYAGEPTRADYGRYGAPGGYDYERSRPAETGSDRGDSRPADTDAIPSDTSADTAPSHGADDEPLGPTIP